MDIAGVVILFSCVVNVLSVSLVTNQEDTKKFPDDILFGASTSAYQIEGAWNEDGKSMSIWDYVVRNNASAIKDGSNGDVAANSYHLYKRDIEMLKELGVAAYRFSIAWTRVLPYGTDNYTNPGGLAYYNNLIDELLANGIKPVVTMYHFDLPQSLSEQGGWLNPEIVDWFGDYARVLYKEFGDRVKMWITVNEPNIQCIFGYETGVYAPLIRSPGAASYECGRNQILANARAYHIYDDEGFRLAQNGSVGIALDMEWGEPASNSTDDMQAAADYMAFKLGQYADPIFTDSRQYPQVMIDKIAVNSATQGLTASRLRSFNTTEGEYVRKTADFLGINHYSTSMVYRNSSLSYLNIPSVDHDMDLGTFVDPSWPSNGWPAENPDGFYKLLHYLKDNYGNIPIYITENGCSSEYTLVDDNRVRYHNNYLSALIDGKNEGVNVLGYFAWSLMDNFEWAKGYSVRFGLYQVNRTSENKTRTPRKSALVYKQMVKTRAIDFSYAPDPKSTTGGVGTRTAPFMLCCLAILADVVLIS